MYIKNNILRRLCYIFVIALFLLGVNFLYKEFIIAVSAAHNKGDYVVLIHGLGRTSFSMQKLAFALSKEGYKVVRVHFPATSGAVEDLVDNYLVKELDKKCTDKDKKINFVTHSLGGIMVRYYAAAYEIKNMGKVVMIAPPNKGSLAADVWVHNRLVRFIMGPSLQEMTTDKNSFVNMLPAPYYDVGVIAGAYDRKVDPEHAKIDNLKDFLVVKKSHTWIMSADEVISATVRFLDSGHF